MNVVQLTKEGLGSTVRILKYHPSAITSETLTPVELNVLNNSTTNLRN
ncbi:hypothetical protein SAMN05444671_4636 [Flavobacterium sp. CF108]|nr:hypothetical protein SAMN04487978_0125 [Flavobacterium sp. fv08]SHI00120.1 hypothetical protein SAMN05444671_4636 [Flavobacterium sp. CF108]